MRYVFVVLLWIQFCVKTRSNVDTYEWIQSKNHDPEHDEIILDDAQVVHKISKQRREEIDSNIIRHQDIPQFALTGPENRYMGFTYPSKADFDKLNEINDRCLFLWLGPPQRHYIKNRIYYKITSLNHPTVYEDIPAGGMWCSIPYNASYYYDTPEEKLYAASSFGYLESWKDIHSGETVKKTDRDNTDGIDPSDEEKYKEEPTTTLWVPKENFKNATDGNVIGVINSIVSFKEDHTRVEYWRIKGKVYGYPESPREAVLRILKELEIYTDRDKNAACDEWNTIANNGYEYASLDDGTCEEYGWDTPTKYDCDRWGEINSEHSPYENEAPDLLDYYHNDNLWKGTDLVNHFDLHAFYTSSIYHGQTLKDYIDENTWADAKDIHNELQRIFCGESDTCTWKQYYVPSEHIDKYSPWTPPSDMMTWWSKYEHQPLVYTCGDKTFFSPYEDEAPNVAGVPNTWASLDLVKNQGLLSFAIIKSRNEIGGVLKTQSILTWIEDNPWSDGPQLDAALQEIYCGDETQCRWQQYYVPFPYIDHYTREGGPTGKYIFVDRQATQYNLCKRDVRNLENSMTVMEIVNYNWIRERIVQAQVSLRTWADKECSGTDLCLLGAKEIHKTDLGIAFPLFIIPVDVGYSYYNLDMNGFTLVYSKQDKTSYCYNIEQEQASLGGPKVGVAPFGFDRFSGSRAAISRTMSKAMSKSKAVRKTAAKADIHSIKKKTAQMKSRRALSDSVSGVSGAFKKKPEWDPAEYAAKLNKRQLDIHTRLKKRLELRKQGFKGGILEASDASFNNKLDNAMMSMTPAAFERFKNRINRMRLLKGAGTTLENVGSKSRVSSRRSELRDRLAKYNADLAKNTQLAKSAKARNAKVENLPTKKTFAPEKCNALYNGAMKAKSKTDLNKHKRWTDFNVGLDKFAKTLHKYAPKAADKFSISKQLGESIARMDRKHNAKLQAVFSMQAQANKKTLDVIKEIRAKIRLNNIYSQANNRMEKYRKKFSESPARASWRSRQSWKRMAAKINKSQKARRKIRDPFNGLMKRDMSTKSSKQAGGRIRELNDAQAARLKVSTYRAKRPPLTKANVVGQVIAPRLVHKLADLADVTRLKTKAIHHLAAKKRLRNKGAITLSVKQPKMVHDVAKPKPRLRPISVSSPPVTHAVHRQQNLEKLQRIKQKIRGQTQHKTLRSATKSIRKQQKALDTQKTAARQLRNHENSLALADKQREVRQKLHQKARRDAEYESFLLERKIVRDQHENFATELISEAVKQAFKKHLWSSYRRFRHQRGVQHFLGEKIPNSHDPPPYVDPADSVYAPIPEAQSAKAWYDEIKWMGSMTRENFWYELGYCRNSPCPFMKKHTGYSLSSDYDVATTGTHGKYEWSQISIEVEIMQNSLKGVAFRATNFDSRSTAAGGSGWDRTLWNGQTQIYVPGALDALILMGGVQSLAELFVITFELGGGRGEMYMANKRYSVVNTEYESINPVHMQDKICLTDSTKDITIEDMQTRPIHQSCSSTFDHTRKLKLEFPSVEKFIDCPLTHHWDDNTCIKYRKSTYQPLIQVEERYLLSEDEACVGGMCETDDSVDTPYTKFGSLREDTNYMPYDEPDYERITDSFKYSIKELGVIDSIHAHPYISKSRELPLSIISDGNCERFGLSKIFDLDIDYNSHIKDKIESLLQDTDVVIDSLYLVDYSTGVGIEKENYYENIPKPNNTNKLFEDTKIRFGNDKIELEDRVPSDDVNHIYETHKMKVKDHPYIPYGVSIVPRPTATTTDRLYITQKQRGRYGKGYADVYGKPPDWDIGCTDEYKCVCFKGDEYMYVIIDSNNIDSQPFIHRKNSDGDQIDAMKESPNYWYTYQHVQTIEECTVAAFASKGINDFHDIVWYSNNWQYEKMNDPQYNTDTSYYDVKVIHDIGKNFGCQRHNGKYIFNDLTHEQDISVPDTKFIDKFPYYIANDFITTTTTSAIVYDETIYKVIRAKKFLDKEHANVLLQTPIQVKLPSEFMTKDQQEKRRNDHTGRYLYPSGKAQFPIERSYTPIKYKKVDTIDDHHYFHEITNNVLTTYRYMEEEETYTSINDGLIETVTVKRRNNGFYGEQDEITMDHDDAGVDIGSNVQFLEEEVSGIEMLLDHRFEHVGNKRENSRPTFGDVDNDGYPDLIVADSKRSRHFYKNVAGVFDLQLDELDNVYLGEHITPAFSFYDDDEYVDLITANEYTGDIQLYINNIAGKIDEDHILWEDEGTEDTGDMFVYDSLFNNIYGSSAVIYETNDTTKILYVGNKGIEDPLSNICILESASEEIYSMQLSIDKDICDKIVTLWEEDTGECILDVSQTECETIENAMDNCITRLFDDTTGYIDIPCHPFVHWDDINCTLPNFVDKTSCNGFSAQWRDQNCIQWDRSWKTPPTGDCSKEITCFDLTKNITAETYGCWYNGVYVTSEESDCISTYTHSTCTTGETDTIFEGLTKADCNSQKTECKMGISGKIYKGLDETQCSLKTECKADISATIYEDLTQEECYKQKSICRMDISGNVYEGLNETQCNVKTECKLGSSDTVYEDLPQAECLGRAPWMTFRHTIGDQYETTCKNDHGFHETVENNDCSVFGPIFREGTTFYSANFYSARTTFYNPSFIAQNCTFGWGLDKNISETECMTSDLKIKCNSYDEHGNSITEEGLTNIQCNDKNYWKQRKTDCMWSGTQHGDVSLLGYVRVVNNTYELDNTIAVIDGNIKIWNKTEMKTIHDEPGYPAFYPNVDYLIGKQEKVEYYVDVDLNWGLEEFVVNKEGMVTVPHIDIFEEGKLTGGAVKIDLQIIPCRALAISDTSYYIDENQNIHDLPEYTLDEIPKDDIVNRVCGHLPTTEISNSTSCTKSHSFPNTCPEGYGLVHSIWEETEYSHSTNYDIPFIRGIYTQCAPCPDNTMSPDGHTRCLGDEFKLDNTNLFIDTYEPTVFATHLQKNHHSKGNAFFPTIHRDGGIDYIDNEVYSDTKFLICNSGYVPKHKGIPDLIGDSVRNNFLSYYDGTCSGYTCQRCPVSFIEDNQRCVPCPPGKMAGWAYDDAKGTSDHNDNECVVIDSPPGYFQDTQNKEGDTVGGTYYPYITHCDHWLYHPAGGLGAYQDEVNQYMCKFAVKGSKAVINLDTRVVKTWHIHGQKVSNDRTRAIHCTDYQVCNGEEIIGCKPGYIWYRQTPNDREDEECVKCNEDESIYALHEEMDDYEYCDGTHKFQCDLGTHTYGDILDGKYAERYVGIRDTWRGSNLAYYTSQTNKSIDGSKQYVYRPDWDMEKARVQADLPWVTEVAHAGEVSALAVRENTVVSGGRSYDGGETLKLWDKTTGTYIALNGQSGSINSVDIAPDGTIVSASSDGSVAMWTSLGNWIWSTTHHEENTATYNKEVNSVAFSPDGTRIVSGGSDGSVIVQDIDGDLNQTLTGHSEVWAVAWGNFIVSGGKDNVRKWEDGSSTVLIDVPYVASVAIHGSTVIAAARETIYINDTSTWIIASSDVYALAFSPDGKHFVSVGDDIQVWSINRNLERQMPPSRLRTNIEAYGHVKVYSRYDSSVLLNDQSIKSVAWGAEIITGGKDKTIRIWKDWDQNNHTHVRLSMVDWYEQSKCLPVPNDYFALDREWKLYGCGYSKDQCIHRTFHRIYPFIQPTDRAPKYMFTQAVRETSYDEIFRFTDRQCLDGYLRDGCLKEYCSREGQTNCWCGEEEDFCTMACVDSMCVPACSDQVCDPDFEICFGMGDSGRCARVCVGPSDNFCVTNEGGLKMCRHYNEDWNSTRLQQLVPTPDSPCFVEMPNIPETQCKNIFQNECFCNRDFLDNIHSTCLHKKIEPQCSVPQDDGTCTYMPQEDLTKRNCVCGNELTEQACYQKEGKCGVHATVLQDCSDLLSTMKNTKIDETTSKCRPTGEESLLNSTQCRQATSIKKSFGSWDNFDETFTCEGEEYDEPGCIDPHADNYNQYAVIPKKCEYL